MKDDSLQTIELEMAILARRITSISSNKKHYKLDRSAYLLLHQITTTGTAGVKQLACELRLDISTVSRQAAALEVKGFVSKVPSPHDRRSYFYQVTELGSKELYEYKQFRLSRFSELLDDWSEEEQQHFGQLLKKFNHAIRDVT